MFLFCQSGAHVFALLQARNVRTCKKELFACIWCGSFCVCTAVSACVHLVDLVHHSEGAAVELLQGHEVQHGGHAALSSALMVRRQLVQLRAAAKLHSDPDAVLIILLLKHIYTTRVWLTGLQTVFADVIFQYFRWEDCFYTNKTNKLTIYNPNNSSTPYNNLLHCQLDEDSSKSTVSYNLTRISCCVWENGAAMTWCSESVWELHGRWDRARPHLVLWVQIHLSGALHGAKEITEALIDLIHQLLQRIQPALFGLTHTHTHTHVC